MKATTRMMLCLLLLPTISPTLPAQSPCLPTAPATVVRLSAGDSVARQVDARQRENHTDIQLDSGAVYTFVARGEWKDGGVRPVNARGFHLRDVPWYSKPLMFVAAPLRRAHAEWFELVGEVATRPHDFFAIGDSLAAWPAPISGELVVFANDVNIAYGNNQGCLTLVVRRAS